MIFLHRITLSTSKIMVSHRADGRVSIPGDSDLGPELIIDSRQ